MSGWGGGGGAELEDKNSNRSFTQYTHNVTMRRVSTNIVTVEINKYYIS